jgi:hypothetical protein
VRNLTTYQFQSLGSSLSQFLSVSVSAASFLSVSVSARREAGMRALIAAATGLVVALALVLTLTALGTPTGRTSPEPLLTTVPAHP